VFPFEARIFHSISLALVVLATVYAPYNLFEGLYAASVSSVVIAVFFFSQYYNSRFRGKTYNTTVFALTGVIFFSVNYFLNSGINGSTDLIWPSYLLLLLAISPYRQHLLWIVTYIVAFALVHVIEYKYPSLVQYPFDMGRGKFIDRITAFPMPVIAISIIIIFLRKSYDKERAAVEEKAATIELRNEQILLQRNQLEQSNAEKNKLLSIISHDMRAPFTHIQGYLQLLSQIEMGSIERLEVEKELLSSTDQTIEMLSNLLYWSRSQMEGVAANLRETNLLDSVYNTLKIGKALAAKKHIALNYNIEAGITVIADANMLQLVVRNLINNAIKFTPEGGAIDIHTEVTGSKCKMTIHDNGTGIAPGKKDTLFSMTSGSTFGTNNEKGVGLGLPLCKEFMERQGGSIDFDSVPGEGSSFYIFIPLAKSTVARLDIVAV
jgi:signal transduction histidine kinase